MPRNIPIDKERWRNAHTLANMFPEGERVYAYFNKEGFYLFPEMELDRISKVLKGKRECRRMFYSSVYEMRN